MVDSVRLVDPFWPRVILDAALGVSLIATDNDGRIIYFSRGSERMLTFCADEVVGKLTPLAFHDPQELAEFGRVLSASLGRKIEGFAIFRELAIRNAPEEREWTYIRKDGSRLTVNLSVTELRDSIGEQCGFLGSAVDITQRKDAESALRHEKIFFDRVINGLPCIFYLYDADLRLRRWNRNHETLLGYTAKEIEGFFVGDWHPTPELRQMAIEATRGIIEQGVALDAIESSLLHKNGTTIPFLLTGVRIESPDGPMMAGVGIDLTERRKLEEQLRQTQKLESVGRLAGGIAHDFNNILTTIMGNLDLGRMVLDPSSRVLSYMDNALRAAESAAMLTRQLLAFSRKETISPRVLDLNQVLQGMRGMLSRLLGEDIELTFDLSADVWPVLIDPGQLDQIILNLIVNARDAMADGGKLSVETGTVILDPSHALSASGAAPGEYVTLSISDTGIGMTEEVKGHIFEPFYTTKEMGRGTGLGLSTVFGAVKQNGGHIDVRSEPGRGSTFLIFLPKAKGSVAAAAPTGRCLETRGGTETIILAEDDAGIRAVAEESLSGLGYRILVCQDGRSALDAALAAGTIDLLVTDLIMPDINGKELAKRMSSRLPKLRVLYTSGYTADIIGRHGMLEPGVEFLPKPYVPSELARRIRACLDGPEPLDKPG